MRGGAKGALCALLAVLGHAGAQANNIGENVGWQFQTTTDKANRAVLEDLRQKRISGYYSAPIYNTTVQRQFNCSVSAAATGSSSGSTAVGNSPSTTGNTASSSGNASQTSVTQGNPADGLSSSVTGQQSNTGAVSSGVVGDVVTRVAGNTSQVLNTSQQNSGNQSSSVSGSSGCQFGPLN